MSAEVKYSVEVRRIEYGKEKRKNLSVTILNHRFVNHVMSLLVGVVSVVLGWGLTVGGTEGEGASRVDDGLVAVADHQLVVVPELRPVHAVVDVGEQVALLQRRRHELDMASMERVVEDVVPDLVPLQLPVEVPMLVRLEHLTVDSGQLYAR